MRFMLVRPSSGAARVPSLKPSQRHLCFEVDKTHQISKPLDALLFGHLCRQPVNRKARSTLLPAGRVAPCLVPAHAAAEIHDLVVEVTTAVVADARVVCGIASSPGVAPPSLHHHLPGFLSSHPCRLARFRSSGRRPLCVADAAALHDCAFAFVALDEASSIPEPEALIPICKGV